MHSYQMDPKDGQVDIFILHHCPIICSKRQDRKDVNKIYLVAVAPVYMVNMYPFIKLSVI